MLSKKEPNKQVKCPRCEIWMQRLYDRSFGVVGSGVYECPKCKGIITHYK